MNHQRLTPRRRRWALLGAASLALLLAGAPGGCATGHAVGQPEVAGPVELVDTVMLYTGPTAFNGQGPGSPDSVQVGVYVFRKPQAQAVAIHQGVLEFLLFEGAVPATEVGVKPPFYSWHFAPADLAPNAAHSMLGWGYQMGLSWKDHPSAAKTMTMVARFRPVRGEPVYSSPAQLMLGPG